MQDMPQTGVDSIIADMKGEGDAVHTLNLFPGTAGRCF